MRTFPFLLIVCFLIVGPVVSNTLRAEEVEVAVLLKGMNNPYWKTLYDGARDKAAELGVRAYIQGVESDSDSEAQLNMCNTMLLRKPRALVFGAVNNVNLAPCLRKADEMGMLLVDVDGGTGKEDAEKMGIELDFSVASNNYDVGKKGAEYLSGLKGKVLVIEGFPGSVPAGLRKQGFVENLPVGLEIVSSVTANWDRLKSADIANATITRHPDLAVIFAANDIMALGAAEALLSRGVTGVKVIGVDGISDAVRAIKGGRLTASIAQLPYLMGAEAVEKAHKSVTGQAVYEFNQKVPIVTLDKDVLSRGDEPLLRYLK